MMVMNAFMMNSMALNSAIFMTIRNMVFGPKKGPQVKYVNYGYNKRKANKKPELVLHSPAAFVKKPHPHREHHYHSSNEHHPHPDQYDDPDTYQVHSPTHFRRKDQRWKQKIRGDKIRKGSKIRRPAPTVEPASQSYLNGDPNFDFHNAQEVKNQQPLLPNHFEPSEDDHPSVDASSSYLNSNQYLQPSYESFQNQNYNTVPQSHYTEEPTAPTQIPADEYQSHENIYFSPSNNVFNNKYSHFESVNPYSSKYSEELSTSDSNGQWRP